MTIKQISTVLNEAVKQMVGEEALDSYSLKDIVDLGSSQGKDWQDKFYNALYDRIYKLVVSVRNYVPQSANIMRDFQTFGAILEKVYVDPVEAEDNEAWALQNGSTVDPFVINKQTLHVKVFNTRNTWSLPFTIYDNQMNTAFNSEQELVTFTSNLFLAVDNDFAQMMEAQEHWTKINFIAEKLYFKSQNATSKGVINLLDEYKVVKPDTTLTAITCRTDKEFLRFCAMTISQYVKKLQSRTTLFNNEGYYRFTPTEDCHVEILSDFAKAMQYYLDSDTYHNELVSLPRYDEIMYWQATGDGYEFNDASSVAVTTSSNHAIEQANIVGFVFDHDALGMTIWNERTTAQYNASGEYTNYWKKADIGLFNDTSENAIVFIIEDTVEPEPEP